MVTALQKDLSVGRVCLGKMELAAELLQRENTIGRLRSVGQREDDA